MRNCSPPLVIFAVSLAPSGPGTLGQTSSDTIRNKRWSLIIVGVAMAIVSDRTMAQKSAPNLSGFVVPVHRSADAVLSAGKALDFLGGPKVIEGVSAISIQMTVKHQTQAGSSSEGRLTWTRLGEDVAITRQIAAGTSRASTGGGRAFIESDTTSVARALGPNFKKTVFGLADLGNELDKRISDPKVSISSTVDPDGNIKITFIDTSNTTYARITRQVWTIDAASGKPISIAYSVPSLGVPPAVVAHLLVVETYSSKDGLTFPAHFHDVDETSREDTSFETTDVEINPKVSASDFKSSKEIESWR